MVAQVGDKQCLPIAGERHPLGLVESSLVEATLGEARGPRSSHVEHPAGVEIGDHHAVMVGIGDEEPMPGGIDLNLARERQHGVGRAGRLELHGSAIDQPAPIELDDQ